MRFSGRRRFSIQFSTFVDLNWTRTIFFGAMFLAVVLYTVTVLCQIASGLPKLQSSQVSKIAVFDEFRECLFRPFQCMHKYRAIDCRMLAEGFVFSFDRMRYFRCIYCNWPRSLASAAIISRT